jgi:hypothetical protein
MRASRIPHLHSRLNYSREIEWQKSRDFLRAGQPYRENRSSAIGCIRFRIQITYIRAN